MQNHTSLLMFLAMVLIMLCSCVVGPNYVRPPVEIPAKYKEAPKGWKAAHPQDENDRGEWWKVFNDPQLNALEAQLDCNNQSIIQAVATYRQARALVDEAIAAYFPTVTGTFAVTAQGQGGTNNGFSSSGSSSSVGSSSSSTSSGSSGSSGNSTYSLFLNASWEFDIWGAIRRAVEASKAGAQASAAQLATTRLLEQATLAQSYFELRAADTDQKLLDDTVKGYQASLKFTRHQYASGVAALADVVQARSQLEVAQAQAINNGIARAQFEHAIAVLIGKPPAAFSFPPQPLTATPPFIPVEVPSVLLERRPDVAQAERLMAQANAQIGVAISAYFPTLTLMAAGNLQNNNSSGLFSLPGLAWAIGPELAETLLDGGLRNATVAAARANYDATVASYRQTVLTAFQNVEDNLASLRILKQQGKIQDQAAADARLALKLVINQYRAGTVPYSSVLLAEINAYAAEKNAADTRGLEMTTAVTLIKALGGSWDVSSITHAGDPQVYLYWQPPKT
jgi:NodT family efflux transporter outer membrane factor (OMF) lipoprotein